jgi:hypothetical protein
VKGCIFKCTQWVAKHFHNLQAPAERQIERVKKEWLTHEAREAAKAVKVAEKAAAKEAE